MAFNFCDYVNFFKTLAEKHISIEYFMFGDMRQMQDEQKSKFEYPCLVLNLPEINSSGNNQDSLLFNIVGSFSIMKQYAKGDFEAQEQTFVDTEALIRDAMSYIRRFGSYQVQVDSPRMIFTNLRFQIENAFTADNLAGWTVSFTYQYAPNYEFDTDKWNL